MIGLNKDDEEAREERMKKGLKPRVRPINQGSLFLKLAFDFALHSPPAREAAKALQPIQQGIGAKRGMEVMAHVCSALYGDGYAILKLDASNGFQEVKRASMHRAMFQRCPSLLSLFQKYYTKNSICFFENGSRLVNASEGARMGCKLSSFGFTLTVHPIYERVRDLLSREDDG